MDRNDYSKHEFQLYNAFPKEFDIIIDATGAHAVIEHCPKFSKCWANILIYSVATKNVQIKISPYVYGRIDIIICTHPGTELSRSLIL